MKKLDSGIVSMTFSILFILAIFVFTVFMSGWGQAFLFLAIIAFVLFAIVAPYAFTWVWNKYIATEENEEEDGSDES